MKFAHFSHVWNKPGMSPSARYDQLWRELALADELGFDFGFTVEHHFNPYESWMPSPPVYCTGGAARTTRLRLGPMGYVVPLYNPIRIAEEVAVLDHVLNGRLEVGLVSGIVPEYFPPYQADFQNRRLLTDEAVSLLKTAFCSEGPFNFEGQFHRYRDLVLSVRPLQQPHPPLWVQSRDPDTLEFLAKEGIHTGYLLFVPRQEAAPRYHEYLRLWQQAGHPQKPNIAYWTLVYVDETDEKALANATPHIVYAFTKVFGTDANGSDAVTRRTQNFEKRGEHSSAEISRNLSDVEYLLKRNLIFVGSPQTVIQRIKEAAEEGVFNTLLAEVNFGALDEETLMRSIQLLGTEVIPALRGFEPY